MSKDNIKHWPDKGLNRVQDTNPSVAAVAGDEDVTGAELGKELDDEADVELVRASKRSIYLLPNLFTTGALFGGFYAILMSLNGSFEMAAIAIFAAQFFDGLDGRVARLTNTQSEFGVEYDSLSDMVSFGVAPAVLIYTWMLEPLGNFGWSAAFVYTACAALRLARFNVKSSGDDKRYFMGLASPPAAAIIWGSVWAGHELEPTTGLSIMFALLTIGVGLLMVTGFKYHSFKDINLVNKVPFAVVFSIVMLVAVIMIDPPRVLLAIAVVYALYAPLLKLLQIVRKAARSGRFKKQP